MESFVFYTHYAEKMKKLPPEQVANLLFAICEYVENGTEPMLNDTAADMCFLFIRTQLDKDIEKYENTCKKRAEAGRRSAEARSNKKQQEATNSANAEFTEDHYEEEPAATETTEHSEKAQQSKKNTRKKNDELQKVKYGEFVRMTEDEHKKLTDEYGTEMTARMIEVLDNYKGSKGRTYKNDYRAILSWVVDRVKEEFAKRGGNNYDGSNFDKENSRKHFTPSEGFKRADTDEE